jgi:hypothetical protein
MTNKEEPMSLIMDMLADTVEVRDSDNFHPLFLITVRGLDHQRDKHNSDMKAFEPGLLKLDRERSSSTSGKARDAASSLLPKIGDSLR